MKKVGKNLVVKEGFLQCKYIQNDFEILASQIRKGTDLDSHSHQHEQFGYCFSGTFEFEYGDKKTQINANEYYILKGDIIHSACALEDFYALDFKYIMDGDIIVGESDIKIADWGNCNSTIFNINEHYFSKVKGKKGNNHFSISSEQYECYAMVPRKMIVNIEKEKILLEPMNIYSVPTNKNISFTEENELIVVFVKKRRKKK